MMFAVFNAAGTPVRSGSCPEHALEQQARDGEIVVEWSADKGSATDWHIVDGVLTKK